MNHPRLAVIPVLAFALVGVSSFATGTLTFEERLKAQEAIEHVYFRHRLWPSPNVAPPPAFESAVPKDLITRKVQRYLRESQALDTFWNRPIGPDQLQAEIDRLCRNTKAPNLLRELFAALNNDPQLIAECIARPSLADRLCRNWYAYDSRFHSTTRDLATEASREALHTALRECSGGTYAHFVCQVGRQDEQIFSVSLKPANGNVNLSREEFDKLARDLPPEGGLPGLQETADIFVIRHVLSKSQDRLEFEQRVFEKRSFSDWWASVVGYLPLTLRTPAARYQLGPTRGAEKEDTAGCADTWKSMAQDLGRVNFTWVWSGTEMLVWGGESLAGLSRGGFRYNPATDTWSEMSIGPGCPKGRDFPCSVWTGAEMIVWGGCEISDYLHFTNYDVNTGGRYDPVADTWVPTPVDEDCPSPRACSSAVWTGTEMIVWGGYGADIYSCRDGARFSPETGIWRTLPVGPPELLGRSEHSAFWTGTEMIIWGGLGWNPETGYGFVTLNSGARFDPRTDSWVMTSVGPGCPSPRYRPMSLWTGKVMLVWGGGDPSTSDRGAVYDPVADSWKPMSCGIGCPTIEWGQTAVWTGSEMIVWGGGSGSPPGTSWGRYSLDTDTWRPLSSGPNCPESRYGSASVWTGSEMVVWGGGNRLNSGGRYNPASDSWLPTATDEGYVSARFGHSAVWTGSEMLVWGGNDGFSTGQYYNPRGARYNPAFDTWTPISASGCPLGRANVAAVWTGTEMVVWGGYNIFTSQLDLKTGGRYDPLGDTWRATSTGPGCPSARSVHTGVWTGSEMIIWGGQHSNDGTLATDSARYDPGTDQWRPVTSTGSPTPRTWHTGVWTGHEMIVWGGWGDGGGGRVAYFSSGGRYSPASDTWKPTSQGPGCPGPRSDPSAAWINGEMFVWGGGFNDGTQITLFTSGGLYSPETDSWRETSAGPDCPDGRYLNTCVAAGLKAILWGGAGASSVNTGGVYDTATDSWMPTSERTICNFGRAQHSAVWTGESMIVWGGLVSQWEWPVASGAIYQVQAGPLAIPSCDAQDVAPCATGVLVSWPQDPGQWGDEGSGGARYYRVQRDGAPLSSGGCSGLLSYGDTRCTDDSAPWDGTHSYQVAYVSGCGTSSTGRPVIVWDHAVPPPAGTPGPSDGQASVLLECNLSWLPSSGAESYDLFFGTSSSPPYLATMQVPAFSLPSLQEQTRYFWKVVPINSCGESPLCPTWSFTSVLLPHLTTISWGRPLFNLKVKGSGFQSGIRCFVNGREWTDVLLKSDHKLVLRGSGQLKRIIPKGVPTVLRFLNADGGETSTTWSW